MCAVAELITEPDWEYAENLRVLRGDMSMEKAAARIGATRSAWDNWERKKRRPRDSQLRAIVEAFGCSPDYVGYTAPDGFKLLPNAFFEQYKVDVAALQCKLDVILKKVGA